MFPPIPRFLRKIAKILKKIVLTTIISIPAWILSAGPVAKYSFLRNGMDRSQLFENSEAQQLTGIRSRGLGLDHQRRCHSYANVQLVSIIFFCSSASLAGPSIRHGEVQKPFIISIAAISFKIGLDILSALFSDAYYDCMYDQVRCRFRYYILGDYNVQNSLGDTELHKAIYREDAATFRALAEMSIRENINIELRNNQGLTAFELINILQNRELQSNMAFYFSNMDHYFAQLKQDLTEVTDLPDVLSDLVMEFIEPITFSGRQNRQTSFTPIEIFNNPDLILEIEEPEEEKKSNYNQYALLPG